MLLDLWEPGMNVVFVETVVTEISSALGFHHLHAKDRFWELLQNGGITPTRIITAQERMALEEGHKKGNLGDPIRTMFIQKKTSQLVKLGIALATLNQKILTVSDSDKAARPIPEDIKQFMFKATSMAPKIVAFVTRPEVFAGIFPGRDPAHTPQFGPQPEQIGGAEVWFLGSTLAVLRGEVRTKQEDAFFELGERISELGTSTAIRG